MLFYSRIHLLLRRDKNDDDATTRPKHCAWLSKVIEHYHNSWHTREAIDATCQIAMLN